MMILQQNTNRAAEADSKVNQKNHEKNTYWKVEIVGSVKFSKYVFSVKKGIYCKLNHKIRNSLVI